MDIKFWVEEVIRLCNKGYYILEAIEIVGARKELFDSLIGEEVIV